MGFMDLEMQDLGEGGWLLNDYRNNGVFEKIIEMQSKGARTEAVRENVIASRKSSLF